MLPFLLIGKALSPLAKVKKQAWTAMGGAFSQIRKSVDPMQSFSKLLEIVNVLMLPLTYIFTILAMVILKELMPYVGDLILALGDLEKALDDAAKSAYDAIDALEDFITDWYPEVEAWALSLQWIVLLIGDLRNTINETFFPLQKFIDFIDLIVSTLERYSFGGGGGDGGGGGGGGGGWHNPIYDYPPYNNLPSGGWNTSNNLTIDLRGAVVDDRDKLIRDITEQVMMRLG
jgi:hypothetical protein